MLTFREHFSVKTISRLFKFKFLDDLEAFKEKLINQLL